MLVCLDRSAASAESELGLALKGGPNAARMAGDNRFDKHGFSGGLAARVRWLLGGRFSLGGQAELLYTPRGTDVIVDGKPLGQFRMRYLDVTIAVRPEARLGPVSVYLLLGGGVDTLLHARKKHVSGANDVITSGLHRIDIALLAGTGVAWHLPRSALGPLYLDTLFVEARHDHGLRAAAPDSDGYQHRTSSLMLGLSIALGAEPAARMAAAPAAAASGAPTER